MIKNKKKLIFRAVILILVIFFMNSEVFSVVFANGAGGGYEDPGGGKTNFAIIKENYIIETYIEKGGGYFLNAFSSILSFSNRIEMKNLEGFDSEEIQMMLDSAINNIISAKDTYYILIQIAQDTPYDPEIISKLRIFYYQYFMIEYSLNSEIFKEVEGYLKNGDITGTFIRIYNSFIKIEGLLLAIKYELSLNKMPTLSKIWEINEIASNTLTFGQYITRIFYAI